MRLSPTFSRRARQICFAIHLWTGLILGAWFVVIGLTGSVLAWRSEFTGWEARHRVGAQMPAAGEPIIPLSKAIAALKQFDPKLTPERGMFLPPSEYGYYVYNLYTRKNDGFSTTIYLVDPVTARVYPPVQRATLWVETFENLHANLVAGARGTVANGVLSFFAVFLLASGLWLWWPSNLAQLRQRVRIKRGASLRRTLYDWHNVLGIYLFGLLLLLSVTAVLLVVNGQTDSSLAKAIDGALGTKAQVIARGSGTVSGGQMPDVPVRGQMLPLDEMVSRARAAVPNATLLFAAQPQHPGQPFQASFDPISFNNGLVLFDPYTGERLQANGRTFSLGERTMRVVGDLHYGWFGGAWSKFLYGLSGLLPLGLYVTGLLMWWKRLRAKKQLQKRRYQKENSASSSITAKV